MNSTIYIKGNPGFKEAILKKLGGTWIHGIDESEDDVIGFSIPESVLLKDFRKTIGSNIIIGYDLLFLDESMHEPQSALKLKYTPENAIRMTIWTNNDGLYKR